MLRSKLVTTKEDNFLHSFRTIRLALLLLAAFQYSKAQVSVYGKPGLVSIPTAEWFENKPFGVSYAFVPDAYASDLFRTNLEAPKNRARIVGFRAQFTSFFEVGFNLTQRLEIKEQIGIGDRHMDARFRILKENNKRPSLVLGVTVPFSQAPVVNHDYIVATKTFGSLKLNLGYGSPYQMQTGDNSNLFRSIKFESKESPQGNDYLVGFFGGASYQLSDNLGITAEYNTNTINTGVFYKHDFFIIQVNSFEFKALSVTLSSHFSLQ